jgi:hypothetical protein
MRFMRIVTVVALAISSAPAFADTVWVKANAQPGNLSCATVCRGSGKDHPFPVQGGKYGPDFYSLCVGEMDGLRPGYQVSGAFGNACNVGHDGKEKATQPAACLCSDADISAQ